MLRLKFRVVFFGLLLLPRCFAQNSTAASTSDATQLSVDERVRVSEILISTPQPYDRRKLSRLIRERKKCLLRFGEAIAFQIVLGCIPKVPRLRKAETLVISLTGSLLRRSTSWFSE